MESVQFYKSSLTLKFSLKNGENGWLIPMGENKENMNEISDADCIKPLSPVIEVAIELR